ncbi:hypothetical protein NKR23_g5753 [Pleurostoma richardsiae]|uniref:Uncharacterized protein n=1 Tax=Pleurostoma richardsiae TaxID=41990 RepID=A0AA38VTA7_9PEZI|nr:hypothetical protein NKR23_g5753 [Pleurostoma richardsiae]
MLSRTAAALARNPAARRPLQQQRRLLATAKDDLTSQGKTSEFTKEGHRPKSSTGTYAIAAGATAFIAAGYFAMTGRPEKVGELSKKTDPSALKHMTPANGPQGSGRS